MTQATFRQQYTIPYFLCDRKQTIRLSMLVNYMLKVSGEQTAQIASEQQQTFFHEQNRSWIILAYEFDIKRLPRRDETVTFETYASEYNRLFCYREFKVYDEQENLIVATTATFGIMDLTKRKIVRIPEAVAAPYQATYNKQIRRTNKPEPLQTEQALHKAYLVRYTDIDQNNHVNNSVYLTWMLDALEADFLNRHDMCSGIIKFEKEVSQVEQVSSYVQTTIEEDAIRTDHAIQSADVTNARASFYWQRSV